MTHAMIVGSVVCLVAMAAPAVGDTYAIPSPPPPLPSTGVDYLDVEPSCVSIWQETNNQFGLQKYDIYDPETGLLVYPKDRLETYAGTACSF